MAAIVQPKSVDDVVGLIHRLYQPGKPEELSRIQDILQETQRSAGGWQLADSLLERSESLIRFFGALTFTIKLNSDWESLSEEDIPGLCQRLVGWLVKFVNEDTPPLAVKKLCSTLVVFFIRFSETWTECIRTLVCCLAAGRTCSEEEIKHMPPSAHLLQTMKPGAKLVTLWFSATLVEEIGKVDMKNIKNHHFVGKIQTNESEAVELIRSAIEMPNGAGHIPENYDSKVVEAALKCYQAWVSYSFRAYIDFKAEFPLMKSLMQTAINWLAAEDVFEASCDFVIGVLSTSFGALTPEDNQALANILTSPWAHRQYELLMSGDAEWGSIQFSQLLVTFAEATLQKIAKSFKTPSGRAMIEMLHGLLNIPGYPQVEEEVSGTTFEFWGSLVELLLDSDGDDDIDDPWIQECHGEVKRAVEEFWRKIRIPPAGEHAHWTKDQKDGFMSYRKDVADFVESAFSLIGRDLFQQLVDQVTKALNEETPAWEEIEASLFLLGALSDSLGDEPYEDIFLAQLFGSPIFTRLSDPEIFARLPDPKSVIFLRTMITSVSLIGSYASFFERRPSYLPPALTFLFICIRNPTLARNASRSISSLCSSCRTTLTPELAAFLQQYQLFTQSPSADDIAKERVLCAISYVIQALPDEASKLSPISDLLNYVEADTQKCLLLLSHGQVEAAKESALLSLRCLASIGKGLQAPDDVPVDLSNDSPPPPSFWTSSQGYMLQEKLFSLLQVLARSFPQDTEVIESACAVFKTGFTESSPGLFVFPPALVTNFLLENSSQTETILQAACTLVSSHTISGSVHIGQHVEQFLDFLSTILPGITPHSHPELATTIADFLTRLLRRYTRVLVFYHEERLGALFIFLLEALQVRETLVKKQAARFWSAFISVEEDDVEVKKRCDLILGDCGERLMGKLMWEITGGCQRSEVDDVVEPLKKLVTKRMETKKWMQKAMGQLQVTTLTDADKRIWIEKVVNLRGKRQTNQIAKELWLKARGTEFAYAS
ncbi:armadillo-type protein [Pyronema domesticum]|uniref:Similar to Importin beta-like protein kap111 acc. no. Q09796 n=1 Tax=Pyronema omphalodes (strain CBS 100304) TaxID=1076935 RepID=U4LSL2_PYROM|nr:armadillo-type protein [Pyronema domesticum]CCX34609.1 Similar to Importin beta-like protein kap111; acc. no. Q09796 [Pyronema omphalodes CBS 100304]